jgi:hypothetical protein
MGIDPRELSDADLLKELETIHRTRHETLLHAPDDALAAHSVRMTELEAEYMRRNPVRPVSPERTREGARAREA